MEPSDKPLESREPESREDLWQHIATGEISTEAAQRIWDRVTRAANDAGAGPCDQRAYEDFVATVVEVGRTGGVQERLALMEIVDFRPLAAQARYSALVDEAGACGGETQQSSLLWRMATLFAPTDPPIARLALDRMLAIDPGATRARLTLAIVLQRLSDDAAAESELHAVVAASEDAPSLQVEALDRLGYMAMARGQLDEAMFIFERSLRLHRKRDNRTGVLAILHQLAEAAELSGDPAKAEPYLYQALELHERSDSPVAIGLALSHLARLATARGDAAAARALIQRALPMLERQDVSVVAAYEIADAGDVARECGDADTAEHAYLRTRVLSTAVGDDAGVARAFGGLGYLASEREDYDRAERLFRNASALYEKVGREGMSAKMLIALGSAHYDSGDRLGARQHWVRAVVRFDHLGRREEARKVRDLIGRMQ